METSGPWQEILAPEALLYECFGQSSPSSSRFSKQVEYALIISHNHIHIFSPLCNTVFENFITTTRLVLQVTSFRFFEMTLRSAKGLELGLPSWSNLKIIDDNWRKCIRSFWVLHFVALWGLAPEHWHTSLHGGKATVLNRQKCVRLEPPKNHQNPPGTHFKDV